MPPVFVVATEYIVVCCFLKLRSIGGVVPQPDFADQIVREKIENQSFFRGRHE